VIWRGLRGIERKRGTEGRVKYKLTQEGLWFEFCVEDRGDIQGELLKTGRRKKVFCFVLGGEGETNDRKRKERDV